MGYLVGYLKRVDSIEAGGKVEGGFYVDPEVKLLFIVRIHSVNGVAPIRERHGNSLLKQE
ncbi:hypothetical protein V6Z12_D02G098300 [Gossypium hirsutum]